MSLEELEAHLYTFTRESAKDIPDLIEKRQSKIDNYELSI